MNEQKRAIVTVVGNDRVGIIARICTELAKHNINVLDISQTILAGTFTMVMAVDVSAMTDTFAQITEEFSAIGKEMGLSIRLQREEIFEAMHTI